MLKISEYELMRLLELIDSNDIIEDSIEQRDASLQLQYQVGKIMKYMSLKDIGALKERMKRYKEV